MKIRSAEPYATAAGRDGFPAPAAPEVAFLGRSNVGKSSLINKLVQRKALARTSGTPGKTRLVHWYRIERDTRAVLFVDLPGYGYAKVAKVERAKWQGLVESYLEARSALKVAVLLQDLRRDVSDDELLLIDWLGERDIPVLVALTKIDKLKPMRRAARVKQLKRQFALPAARVLATSAVTKLGVAELWRAIDAHI